MIVLIDVIFGLIVVLCAIGLGATAWEAISEWAGRRRRGRRSALERRMRAASTCGRCGEIGAVEFRARARGLLRELEESDTGQAVVALVEYGRRAQASGTGGATEPESPLSARGAHARPGTDLVTVSGTHMEHFRR